MKAMFFRLALLVLLLALVALLVPSGMIISTGYAEFEFVVPGQTPAPEEETTETVSGFEDVDAGYLAPLVGGVDPLPIDKSPGYAPDPNGYLSDREYRDDSIAVRIVEGRAYDTTYLVAYVTVADASQIRTTVAGRHNSEDTVRGAVMAKRVNAVLAINGDYYSYRDGVYIIRQGKQYRNYPNGLDTLFIDDKGDFHVVEYASRENVDAFLAELDGEVINSFAFGPLLVRDGKRVEEIHYFDIGTVRETQRMGIAQIGPLQYMCVSTEGPEDPGSRGLTVEEFAELMETLGADIAYNLDGGSSNTLVFQGEKINSPQNPKIRYIFDILYFASAVKPEE